ncbi:RES family NAD+ phosphorylase [Dyadobacter luticola]|uniref:RES domain-containing protein n=1 Tax=Dyadobacter luticola TaxID=1979387 RepID=A0A5R9KUU3_9BACT|nr:RES family NAD+ phosphorylase [Dyadobacter luticola]TLV00001.1 RES domain-containing protein [Dyadobacter luticola]
MPVVYRIVREKFKSQALSTEGSRLYGARWNPKGTGVLYTTSSPELGLVETLAHAPGVRYEDLPAYWLSSIQIPDDIRTFSRKEMPDFWQEKTYERTQHWLKDWLLKPDVLAVALPSVIVPFSQNIILHPRHPLFEEITLIAQERIPIDERLWRVNRLSK